MSELHLQTYLVEVTRTDGSTEQIEVRAKTIAGVRKEIQKLTNVISAVIVTD